MKLKELFEMMPQNTTIYLYNGDEEIAGGLRYDLNKEFFDLHNEDKVVSLHALDYNEIIVGVYYEE